MCQDELSDMRGHAPEGRHGAVVLPPLQMIAQSGRQLGYEDEGLAPSQLSPMFPTHPLSCQDSKLRAAAA